MKNKIQKFCLILVFTLVAFKVEAYSEQEVRNEMKRIDQMDGVADNLVQLFNPEQTNLANQVYLQIPDKILLFLLEKNMGSIYSKRVYTGLYQILSKVSVQDYYQLTYYNKLMHLALVLSTEVEDAKVLEKIKSETKLSIQLAEMIKNRSFSKEFWLYASRFYPTEVLTQIPALYKEPYVIEVMEAIAEDAPTVIKEYIGTSHLNDRILRESNKESVKKLFEIYKTYGNVTKSYVLLNDILQGKLTLPKAHAFGGDSKAYFDWLIELRKQKNIVGNYSLEKELEGLSMDIVVEINMRHDDGDAYRYEPIAQFNAKEIYTLMVYSSEEIFTSTFLGMYDRMMAKTEQKSGFQFLKSLNFNKFRVFAKQCAAYGKLDAFLATFAPGETEKFFELLCQDLDKQAGDLSDAVDLADLYGSIYRVDLKKNLKSIIEKNLIERATAENLTGMKIYGLLYKLMGGTPETYIWQFEFSLPALDRVTQKELFTNGKHIQQHFFFDDEDGKTAFQHFLTQFGPQWKKEDKGSYVLFTTGALPKRMEVYLIKPEFEFEGQNALKELFENNKRFPDLVVHRGHSYYVEHTINSLTNHAKVAILGSCGGYKHVSQALENAMDLQIVSTRQIGTLLVNNALIVETMETIRLGQDVVWPELWKRVRARVGGNPRFNDYVPPHLNMGARFIKAYNSLQVTS